MPDTLLITRELSRAGRALADISQRQLAEAAHVSESTVRDYEKGRRTPSHNNLAAIQRALEERHVEFVPAKEGQFGPGLRINRRSEDRGGEKAEKMKEGKRQTDNPFEKMHALLQDLQDKKKSL